MRGNRIVPLDEPHGAAVNRVETLVHVVELFKRQLVAFVSEQRFNALCIPLVLFAPHFRRYGRVRQIACYLTFHKLVGYITHLRSVHIGAVYFRAAFVLFEVLFELFIEHVRICARVIVQVLEKGQFRVSVQINFHSNGTPYRLMIICRSSSLAFR